MKQKNTAKIFYLLLATVVLLAAFTGCSSREPITAETFFSTAQNNGYTGEVYRDDDSIYGTVYVEKGDAVLMFMEYASKSEALSDYEALKVAIEAEKGSPYHESYKDLSSYNSYGLTSGEEYYYVARVEDTMLVAYASTDSKKEVQDLIKELGY